MNIANQDQDRLPLTAEEEMIQEKIREYIAENGGVIAVKAKAQVLSRKNEDYLAFRIPLYQVKLWEDQKEGLKFWLRQKSNDIEVEYQYRAKGQDKPSILSQEEMDEVILTTPVQVSFASFRFEPYEQNGTRYSNPTIDNILSFDEVDPSEIPMFDATKVTTVDQPIKIGKSSTKTEKAKTADSTKSVAKDLMS